ncbi:hypothetical protein ACJIZ3_005162 [Penstemon smallii]|uniref:Uncharacterized protein n=1 Tax=Penstemon smallii TaxID=265156 RepID=A0ABD3S487_9LAMI
MPAYEALPQKRICLIEIEKKCFGGEKRKEMNSPIYIFSLYSVKSSDMTCNKYAATDYPLKKLKDEIHERRASEF